MFRLRNFFIFFTFAIVSSSATAGMPVGSCIRDPNAEALQKEWKHYLELQKKRTKLNISVMVEKIRMDDETMRLLQAISEVESLMKILDELENKYLKKAFIDTRFNDMISSPDFISKLESRAMDSEIKKSELSFKDDPVFYELLDKIRIEIAKVEIKEALNLFRTYDLGVLEVNYRKSAKQALRLIRKKGATAEVVRTWKKDPPYLRNVPLPAVKLGPFAVRYRSLLMKSIVNFVLDRKVELQEARKSYPRIKQADVDEMNTIVAPTENNSFDDYIYKINDDETAAIDGVVRTLWGEATSCQIQGLAQFEAIGRIITDRSLAVCRSIAEQKGLETKNVEVREKNWSTFLSNWAGIKRPAPGMQNKAYAKLKGLSDFGRKEKMNIHCAAQVISKKNQFSVWNSYSLNKFHTGQFHQNIPNAIYEIQGPQAENDDKALIRILCPEFQTEEQKKLWSYAQSLALEIVKTPDKLIKRISWPMKGDVLFYTHEAPLSFAREVKASHILVDGKKALIRGKGRGVCNGFRLFIPKVPNSY
ncbi:MAG: hypothetical protein WC635_01355 [Bacteriovorax sp.]|jgi:hypothetical protein